MASLAIVTCKENEKCDEGVLRIHSKAASVTPVDDRGKGQMN